MISVVEAYHHLGIAAGLRMEWCMLCDAQHATIDSVMLH